MISREEHHAGARRGDETRIKPHGPGCVPSSTLWSLGACPWRGSEKVSAKPPGLARAGPLRPAGCAVTFYGEAEGAEFVYKVVTGAVRPTGS
jgi:hypothetical protein